jgi:hypothetical protein
MAPCFRQREVPLILSLQLTEPILDANFAPRPDETFHSWTGYGHGFGHAEMSVSGDWGEVPLWSASGSSSGPAFTSSSARRGDPRGLFPLPGPETA